MINDCNELWIFEWKKKQKIGQKLLKKLLQGEKTVSTHQRYPLSLPAGSSNLAAALWFQDYWRAKQVSEKNGPRKSESAWKPLNFLPANRSSTAKKLTQITH